MHRKQNLSTNMEYVFIYYSRKLIKTEKIKKLKKGWQTKIKYDVQNHSHNLTWFSQA